MEDNKVYTSELKEKIRSKISSDSLLFFSIVLEEEKDQLKEKLSAQMKR